MNQPLIPNASVSRTIIKMLVVLGRLMEKLPFAFGGTPGYTIQLMVLLEFCGLFKPFRWYLYNLLQRRNDCDTSEVITLNNPPDLSGSISVTSQVSCFGVYEYDFQVDNILTGTAHIPIHLMEPFKIQVLSQVYVVTQHT